MGTLESDATQASLSEKIQMNRCHCQKSGLIWPRINRIRVIDCHHHSFSGLGYPFTVMNKNVGFERAMGTGGGNMVLPESQKKCGIVFLFVYKLRKK